MLKRLNLVRSAIYTSTYRSTEKEVFTINRCIEIRCISNNKNIQVHSKYVAFSLEINAYIQNRRLDK